MPNRKLLISLVLIICAVSILGVVYFKVLQNPFSKPNAVLSVTASYEQASVILDESLVGKTPYESETLKSGEHTLIIKSSDGSYETKINLLPQTTTALSREVGVGGDFSSGYIVWLEKISGDETSVSVVSNPAGAVVKIDDEEKGVTPINLSNITEGSHTVEISKQGYEKQSIYLKFKNGFKLNVVADIFLLPIPENLEAISYSDKIKVYNLALSDSAITVDPEIWAKAAAYFGKTREDAPTLNFFVDYKGNIYDANGVKTTLDSSNVLSESIVIGYLAQNKGDLSELAQEALAVFGNAKPKEIAKIIPTGIGWLRVRKEASLESAEIAKVNVGETFTILEKKESWVKIKVDETTEGWVSSTYVQKLVQ
ncbi:MAG: PEGA domain-containing protein [bacterium]